MRFVQSNTNELGVIFHIDQQEELKDGVQGCYLLIVGNH
jgi:hypothetical protein